MSKQVYQPILGVPQYQGILPIENGGTGGTLLGGINKNTIGQNNGVFVVDQQGSIPSSSFPDELSNPVTIDGPVSVTKGSSGNIFTITNFDVKRTYDIAFAEGSFTRPTPETISYTAPASSSSSNDVLTINGRMIFIIYTEPGVSKPSITSPIVTVDLSSNVSFVSSAFSVNVGSDTHDSSDWFVGTSNDFLNPVFQVNSSSSNKTTYSVTGLNPATTYYVRVRHKGTSLGYSPWSEPFSFTTKSSFLSYTETAVFPDFSRGSSQTEDELKCLVSEDGKTVVFSNLSEIYNITKNASGSWIYNTTPITSSNAVATVVPGSSAYVVVASGNGASVTLTFKNSSGTVLSTVTRTSTGNVTIPANTTKIEMSGTGADATYVPGQSYIPPENPTYTLNLSFGSGGDSVVGDNGFPLVDINETVNGTNTSISNRSTNRTVNATAQGYGWITEISTLSSFTIQPQGTWPYTQHAISYSYSGSTTNTGGQVVMTTGDGVPFGTIITIPRNTYRFRAFSGTAYNPGNPGQPATPGTYTQGPSSTVTIGSQTYVFPGGTSGAAPYTTHTAGQSPGSFTGSVDLSYDGRYLAVGMSNYTNNTDSISNKGAVVLFEKTANTWALIQLLIPSATEGSVADSKFGSSVKFQNGSYTLIVTQAIRLSGGVPTGTEAPVLIYNKTGSQWTYFDKLNRPSGTLVRTFGKHIEMSSDGNYMAVSDATEVNGSSIAKAKVRIYKKTSTWENASLLFTSAEISSDTNHERIRRISGTSDLSKLLVVKKRDNGSPGSVTVDCFVRNSDVYTLSPTNSFSATYSGGTIVDFSVFMLNSGHMVSGMTELSSSLVGKFNVFESPFSTRTTPAFNFTQLGGGVDVYWQGTNKSGTTLVSYKLSPSRQISINE